ncbi:MAG: PH domain-containing protein [Bacilli bacterium]|nr:PH domain-containing protein [Bacilli bacterium]
MAYIKYKELTKYFNFDQEISVNNLPTYVTDYLLPNEAIYKAYKTTRDKGIFTDKRMILFDVNPLTHSKKIHIISYESISSGAVLFKLTSGAILLSFDSGYQLKLNFIHLKALNKTELRKLFSYIMSRTK